MVQKIKNSKGTVVIGRDANGTEIKIDISELQQEVKQNTKEMRKKRFCPFWISGIAVFISLAALFLSYNEITLKGDAWILGTIGVIAGIIVISNVAQVIHTKDEFLEKVIDVKSIFENQIKIMKDEFTEEVVEIEKKFDEKLNEKDSKIDEIVENNHFLKIVYNFIIYENKMFAIQEFLIFLSNIDDKYIDKKNYFAKEYVRILKNTERKTTHLDKSIIESLSGISYPYGEDIHKDLKDFIIQYSNSE